MSKLRENILLVVATTLLFSNIFIWQSVASASGNKLVVSFLDVGQGDAVYIKSPTGAELLIDGGPPHSLLAPLGKVMSLYDRDIDMIMITNPDTDHMGGFIDLLERYDVSYIVEPGTKPTTETYKTLSQKITEEGAEHVYARRGMVFDLGGGAYFHVLFPDRDILGLDTNTGSIIGKLVYGETSIMFTGDAPNSTEEYVAKIDGAYLDSDILKVGHHGSRTSASDIFVSLVSPEHAVISAGKGNSYGHPHKETLELFQKNNIEVLGTYEKGTITVTSDGKEFSFR